VVVVVVSQNKTKKKPIKAVHRSLIPTAKKLHLFTVKKTM
jgi:hypothetical protein